MSSQAGTTDLRLLLKTMHPSLHPSTFVFCTIPFMSSPHYTTDTTQPSALPRFPSLPSLPAGVEVQHLFRESEGWTVVATERSLRSAFLCSPPSAFSVPSPEGVGMGEEGEEQVEVGLEEGEPAGLKKQILDESNRWKMVTLEVHSSLLAVGFIAAISARFRDRGIPSNVVAGSFHDHIFVPEGKAQLAMDILAEMSSEA